METLVGIAIDKASSLGIQGEKKVSLTQRQTEELEKIFGNLLEFGLVIELNKKDEDSLRSFCRLFSCLDERRSQQYAMTFCNAVARMTKANKAYLIQEMQAGVEEFPQLHTDGVKNLIKELQVLASRSKAA